MGDGFTPKEMMEMIQVQEGTAGCGTVAWCMTGWGCTAPKAPCGYIEAHSGLHSGVMLAKAARVRQALHRDLEVCTGPPPQRERSLVETDTQRTICCVTGERRWVLIEMLTRACALGKGRIRLK